MADTVRFYMEEMLPEIRDLEQKGIFSKVELASIIKKREKFEYALKRRITKKADFLRYIEYEMNLEALRKKRRARMISDTKQSISDYAGPRRIFFIYKRCLTKFHGDISIWLQYISYAKTNSATRMLSKIFAQALQLHPSNAKLWILAAAWEWEENANIVAARTLLQRAIRLNTTTQSLWHEYFRLELVYIAKILARRQILGIDASASDKNTEDDTMDVDEEANTDNMIMLPTVTGEEFAAFKPDADDEEAKEGKQGKGKGKKASSKKSKQKKETATLTPEKAEALKTETNPVLRGDVAMIVYNNGIKEIPSDFGFRKGFLDIANSFIKPRPLQEDSIRIIYDSIAEDFSSLPEARALVARRPIDDAGVDTEGYAIAVAESVKEFWKACDEGKAEMWEKFVENMGAEHQKTQEENLKLYFSKTIDRIFAQAAKRKIHSEKLYLLQVNWIMTSSDLPAEQVAKKALDVLAKAVQQHPESAELSVQQIRLCKTLDKAEQMSRLPAIFVGAVKTHKEIFNIWREYIAFLMAAYKDDDMTKEQVEDALTEAIRITTTLLPQVTVERMQVDLIKRNVARWYLEWIKDVEGLDGLRRVYRQMMLKSLPDATFFLSCIELEKKLAEESSDKKDSDKAILALYDKAIQSDPKNEDIHLSHLKYLNDTHQIEKANSAIWRASKAVADSDAFTQRYRDMLEGRWEEPKFEAMDLEVDYSDEENEDDDNDDDAEEEEEDEAMEE
ncbi:U3 snoRNP protein [Actinomortierella ambigua]|nr:U3 snoRNP protein [Actinomortierella ambigua]